MAVSARDILTLLAEIEQGDPLDFGDLPLAEDTARELVTLSMAKFSADTASQGLGPESREALALAISARLLLDNLKLHYQVLTWDGQPAPDAGELLKAIASRAPNT